METGGGQADQPAMSDNPGASDSSPAVEDASNREARGLLEGGGEVSGNIGSHPMAEEFEKWEKKIGVALK